ncbi:hypothetical protein KP509_34G024600 [Ceratopteris richardii]|nr:hypothetical protein KP509_34G024600 [Ceratopteris richardii]
MKALRTTQARQGHLSKAFIFAINLQVPGREQHSAVFYFVTEEPIPHGSLIYRFIHGDDAFRNSRFKLVNKIVRGPWILRTTVGNHGTCLLGKALTCNYVRGPNYLEIDVDIGSSAFASAILHLALGYITHVTVDMAFLVESQAEEELPERVFGTTRIAQIELSAAVFTDPDDSTAIHAMSGELSSWRKFSRSLSFLGHHGKHSKIETEKLEEKVESRLEEFK